MAEYSSISVSGFNSSPPSDDGAETASNALRWATHINKIGTPLKDAVEAIDAALASRFAETPRHGITSAETSAGVTPVNKQYVEGHVFRYCTDAQISDAIARTEGEDHTTAIQNAINVGKAVYIPDGTFMAQGLTADNNHQRFWFEGYSIIKKNANGAIITFSGIQNFVINGRFEGDGSNFTGDNVVKTGNNLTMLVSSSYDAAGRAVLDQDGDGLRLIGTNGSYQTADATAIGYDIEIQGTGVYGQITNIVTAQSDGGIYYNQSGSGGAHSLQNNQIGKLTVEGGSSGNFITGNRILGAVNIEKGQMAIDNNIFGSGADVTLGDGSTAFQSINWGANNIMASGTTLTLTDGLIDCNIAGLGQLRNNGVTVTDNTTDTNDVWDSRVSYAPTWDDDSGGTNDIGNGTLQGYYTQQGRRMLVQIHMQIGSTTSFGNGGAWTFSLPKSASSVLGRYPGSVGIFDNGTGYHPAFAEIAGGASVLRIRSEDGTVTKTVPMTWAENDRIYIQAEYEL